MSGYKVAAPKFIKGAAGRRYVQVDGDLEGKAAKQEHSCAMRASARIAQRKRPHTSAATFPGAAKAGKKSPPLGGLTMRQRTEFSRISGVVKRPAAMRAALLPCFLSKFNITARGKVQKTCATKGF